MPHLPVADAHEHAGLQQAPPQHTLVCALGGLAESLFTVPLVALLLSDLVHLIQQLSDPQLQLRELVLLRHVCIVYCMLAHLDV